MNVVAIIEARMASTRLPGKVMLPVLGKPMLARMVNRVLKAKLLNNVVIATTINETDNAIWDYDFGVLKYRGSEEDVLARVLGAARTYNADIIVELTADCPLVDPAMIDKVIADYMMGGADFVYNRLEPGTPIGMDVRVFSTDKLAEIAAKTDDPADREHVSLHFWEHQDVYRCRNVATALPYWAHTMRLTVDTEEDYELVSRIFEILGADCSLSDIVALMAETPALFEINDSVQQKAVR